jgi:hypothetical protein
MFELINELNAELHKFFNVIPGYYGQKDKIFSIIEAIEIIAKDRFKELEEND